MSDQGNYSMEGWETQKALFPILEMSDGKKSNVVRGILKNYRQGSSYMTWTGPTSMDEERYKSFLRAMNALISRELWPFDYERDIRNTAWFGMGHDPNVDEYKTRWEKEHPEQVKLIKDNMPGSKPAG